MQTLQRTKQYSESAVISTGSSGSFAFNIDLERAHILTSRLTDTLYTDKVASALRETISNALDSGSKTVELDYQDEFFNVTDYGCGMSLKEVENIYASFGASTKEDDLNAVGYYGLGAKSPLAIAENYMVSTCDGHSKIIFMVNKTEQGIRGDLISQKPCTVQGTTVSIPIAARYKSEMTSILSKYWYFKDTLSTKLVFSSDLERLVIPTQNAPIRTVKLDEKEDVCLYWIGSRPENLVKSVFEKDYKLKAYHLVLGGFEYTNSDSLRTPSFHGNNELVVVIQPGMVDFDLAREHIVNNNRFKKVSNLAKEMIENIINNPRLINFINHYNRYNNKRIETYGYMSVTPLSISIFPNNIYADEKGDLYNIKSSVIANLPNRYQAYLAPTVILENTGRMYTRNLADPLSISDTRKIITKSNPLETFLPKYTQSPAQITSCDVIIYGEDAPQALKYMISHRKAFENLFKKGFVRSTISNVAFVKTNSLHKVGLKYKLSSRLKLIKTSDFQKLLEKQQVKVSNNTKGVIGVKKVSFYFKNPAALLARDIHSETSRYPLEFIYGFQDDDRNIQVERIAKFRNHDDSFSMDIKDATFDQAERVYLYDGLQRAWFVETMLSGKPAEQLFVLDQVPRASHMRTLMDKNVKIILKNSKIEGSSIKIYEKFTEYCERYCLSDFYENPTNDAQKALNKMFMDNAYVDTFELQTNGVYISEKVRTRTQFVIPPEYQMPSSDKDDIEQSGKIKYDFAFRFYFKNANDGIKGLIKVPPRVLLFNQVICNIDEYAKVEQLTDDQVKSILQAGQQIVDAVCV